MEQLEDLIKERKNKIIAEFPGWHGNIPVIAVSGKSLAEAWENSMLGLYFYGCEFRRNTTNAARTAISLTLQAKIAL